MYVYISSHQIDVAPFSPALVLCSFLFGAPVVRWLRRRRDRGIVKRWHERSGAELPRAIKRAWGITAVKYGATARSLDVNLGAAARRVGGVWDVRLVGACAGAALGIRDRPSGSPRLRARSFVRWHRIYVNLMRTMRVTSSHDVEPCDR